MLRLFLFFYILLAGIMAVYVLAEPYVRQGLLRDLFVRQIAGEFSGMHYFLDELAASVDSEKLASVLDAYPENSTLPLEIHSISSLELDTSNIQRINQGHVFVSGIRDLVVYKRIGDTDLASRFGPNKIYEPLDRIRIVYRLSLFALLALPVLLWGLNLHMKSRRLENAVVKIGHGEFSTRVSESSKDQIGKLNSSFNTMADRIEKLLTGHKALTNAVAHELRTPVSRIRFQLDLLYQEKDTVQRQAHMLGISDDINEMDDLVDELLSWAKFDREPTALSLTTHSLHESILSVIGTRHYNSGLELDYDVFWLIGDQSTQFMAFDPKKLERAIGNLIGNAENYAKSRIAISVSVDQAGCSIYIDDDGPGIPIEQRKKVLEPFTRLDDSRTRSTGGHGLGLTIVQQIAQWHRGTLEICGSPLGGARFVFFWPIHSKSGLVQTESVS